MSSIMRWRNGLMGLSVMAITPVSHEVSEPHDLETGRAILLIPTSTPPGARSGCVYRESGLVLGSEAPERLLTTNVCFGSPLIRRPPFRYRPAPEIQTDPPPASLSLHICAVPRSRSP